MNLISKTFTNLDSESLVNPNQVKAIESGRRLETQSLTLK